MASSNEEAQEIFKKLDKNGDGKISPDDLKSSLAELGTAISSLDAQHSLRDLDKDGDGFIDLEEFNEFYENNIVSGGVDEDLKDAFDLYDLDKNAVISAAELHTVMNKVGNKCSLSDCVKMIRQVDVNGDGFVNLEEFKMMFQKR